MNRCRLVLLALAIVAAPVEAQVVRGVVSERAGGTPLAGVLVVLERPEGGAAVGSALTNERGEYAIRSPAAGSYRLNAKRIGVQRFISDAFTLTDGESRRLDVSLETVQLSLPEIRVSATALCILRPNQGQRVEALWDEARTALTATQISLRDRLFQGHVIRYVRELEPRNLRILGESRTETRGVMDRPFTSLSGDSLSRGGYWTGTTETGRLFYAPDAEVLLSAAFQRDHCYYVEEGGRSRRGLIGIFFEPRPERSVPEVRGTLWLDARTFELRLVEFRYTRLELADGSDRVGGEVQFARVSNGAWIVRRWFIRVPQSARYLSPPVGVQGNVPSVLVRPTIYRLVEEGGNVFAEGLRTFENAASIAGQVLDSAGKPFPGAFLRLGGTPYITTADAAGQFRFENLPPGRFSLIAEHPSYDAVGSPLADDEVDATEGETKRVTLRAAGTVELVSRLCDGKRPQRRRATLRLTMLDTATAAPLQGLRVTLRWTQWTGTSSSSALGRTDGVQASTDARGVVAFCDLPSDHPLEVVLPRPGNLNVRAGLLRLEADRISVDTLRVRRPSS